MALILEVISYKGLPVVNPMSARFDESGGSIGRVAENHLALPDAEKVISRHHGDIHYDNGAYFYTDSSLGGTWLCGQERLLSNDRVQLADGDHLKIGEYELAVHMESAQAAPEFPELFTPAAQPPGQPAGGDIFGITPSPLFDDHTPMPSLQPEPLAPAPSYAEPSPPSPFEEHFAPPAVQPFPEDFSFDELLNESQPAPAPVKGSEEFEFPDDLLKELDFGQPQPVAPMEATPQVVAPQSPPAPPGFKGLEEAPEPFSFELEDQIPPPAQMPPPMRTGAESLEPSPLHDGDKTGLFAAGLHQPPPLQERSPFAAEVPASIQAKEPSPMAVEAPVIQPAAPVAAEVSIPPAIQPVAPPQAEPTPVETPSPAINIPRPGRPPAAAVEPLPPAAPPQPVAQAPNAPQVQPGVDLFQCFLDGAGLADFPNLTQAEQMEAMKALGAVYRDMVDGMMMVLRARAEEKREIRTDVTVIRTERNNPLKFIPAVEDAMKVMISKKYAGYTDSVEAVREGFADIMKHQMAMRAAMQASMAGILKSFDPNRFERAFEEGIVFQKKAKCWDAYCKAYPNLVAKAMENLFGIDFAEAYEKQMQQLRSMRD